MFVLSRLSLFDIGRLQSALFFNFIFALNDVQPHLTTPHPTSPLSRLCHVLFSWHVQRTYRSVFHCYVLSMSPVLLLPKLRDGNRFHLPGKLVLPSRNSNVQGISLSRWYLQLITRLVLGNSMQFMSNRQLLCESTVRVLQSFLFS